MATLILFIAILVALGLSALLTQRFCDPNSRFHILDHPNERSLHTRPTPRSGGLAIVGGILASGLLINLFIHGDAIQSWLLISVLPVAGVSYLDDQMGISVAWRFVVHLCSAAVLVWGAELNLPSEIIPGITGAWPHGVGIVLALAYIVWMINLYNFMDGIDGFAGGMAVIGFGTFGILGAVSGQGLFATTSFVIAASAGGFLFFNFPPARIFMGDVGSSTLGMLAAALSLWGARQGIFPVWVALLVFSPFIVDATITLARRLLRGERVWQAHKTHYYQRLVQLSWGHRKTVLYEYALMLACSLSAIWAGSLGKTGQLRLILFWCGLYLALMVVIARLEKNKVRL